MRGPQPEPRIRRNGQPWMPRRLQDASTSGIQLGQKMSKTNWTGQSIEAGLTELAGVCPRIAAGWSFIPTDEGSCCMGDSTTVIVLKVCG